MSKDGKTEKATPKKRKQEREKGNLPKSEDMKNFMTMISFFVVVLFFGEWMVQKMHMFAIKALNLIQSGTTIEGFLKLFFDQYVVIMLLVFGVGTIFHILNYIFQVKWLFSFKIIKPDFKKMNPSKYFKNLFSKASLFKTFKSMVMFLLLSYIVYASLKDDVVSISELIMMPWFSSVSYLWAIFIEITIKLLVLLGVIGIADQVFQKFDNEQKIKMKKHEVKDEHKEMAGNPEMKQQQKRMMMELLTNNMSENVQSSKFMITNPTHYSVAIQYDRDKHDVPIVVAKGIDYVALYMRRLADENEVPIIEKPALARQLYSETEEGQEIPKELYKAIIEILVQISK